MKEPSGAAGVAAPPRIAPEQWEAYEGFRETTLATISDPGAVAALRAVGQLLYFMALQFDEFVCGSLCHEVRAVVADLRFLEGKVGLHLGGEDKTSKLSPEEAHLSRGCRALAAALRDIADTLEDMVTAAEEAERAARC